VLPKAGVELLPKAGVDCPNVVVLLLPKSELDVAPKAGVEEEAPKTGVDDAPNAGVEALPKAGVGVVPKAGVEDAPNEVEPNAGALDPNDEDPNAGCDCPKVVLPKGFACPALVCAGAEPKPPNVVAGFCPKVDIPEFKHNTMNLSAPLVTHSK
jgi:hypothetical protein